MATPSSIACSVLGVSEGDRAAPVWRPVPPLEGRRSKVASGETEGGAVLLCNRPRRPDTPLVHDAPRATFWCDPVLSPCLGGPGTSSPSLPYRYPKSTSAR